MTDYAALARELNRRVLENPERRLLIIKEFYVERLAAGDPDGADFVLTLRSITMSDSQPPKWLAPAGFGVGVLTLLFFMLLVLGNVAVSPDRKFPLLVVLALGCGLSASFFTGYATITGQLPFFSKTKPLVIGASGGFAILIIVLLVGWRIYL
jgi:hypothetical protein